MREDKRSHTRIRAVKGGGKRKMDPGFIRIHLKHPAGIKCRLNQTAKEERVAVVAVNMQA